MFTPVFVVLFHDGIIAIELWLQNGGPLSTMHPGRHIPRTPSHSPKGQTQGQPLNQLSSWCPILELRPADQWMEVQECYYCTLLSLIMSVTHAFTTNGGHSLLVLLIIWIELLAPLSAYMRQDFEPKQFFVYCFSVFLQCVCGPFLQQCVCVYMCAYVYFIMLWINRYTYQSLLIVELLYHW